MFKIQEGFVSYGSDLFGRAGRTVAARSKPHRFTTNETDFFAQRVLRYWNSLPALVKASESVTSFKSRLDTFRLSGYQANKLGHYWELSYDIFDRIEELGYKGTMQFLNNPTNGIKQIEEDASYFNRRLEEQSEITFDELKGKSAKYIYNKIRMLQDPYPNPYIKTIDGKKIYIKESYIGN